MNKVIMTSDANLVTGRGSVLALLQRTRRGLGAAWPYEVVRGRAQMGHHDWRFRHVVETLLDDGRIVELWIRVGGVRTHLLILADRWAERPGGRVVARRGRSDVLAELDRRTA